VHNTDELMQRLVHVWHGTDHNIIDNAIDEWCGQKTDTSSNYCYNIQPYDKREREREREREKVGSLWHISTKIGHSVPFDVTGMTYIGSRQRWDK